VYAADTAANSRSLPSRSNFAIARRIRPSRSTVSSAIRTTLLVDLGEQRVDEIGQPLTSRHLREAAYKLMAHLDLRRVRLYDARHSCLTFLAVNGVPDVVLVAWAGHTNAAFTKRKYVHPTAADMGVAVTHLNELLGVSDGPPGPAM
jgi:integrase